MVNMGGAIVHDQMNAARVPIAASHLPHAPQKVLMVVLVQTPALPRAIVDVECHQKGDCSMPLILKLAPLNVARLQGLPGHGPRQGLEVGFFVHTEHDCPALVKPVDALITPQHLGGQSCKLLINHRGRLAPSGARPSTGPEKRSALRASQRLGGGVASR